MEADRKTRFSILFLKGKNDRVRFHAAIALGEIGPGAKNAVPALRKAMADADELLLIVAGEALRKITRE